MKKRHWKYIQHRYYLKVILTDQIIVTVNLDIIKLKIISNGIAIRAINLSTISSRIKKVQ